MLIDDWKKVIKKAGSFRWAVISGLLAGAGVVLPFFYDSMNPKVFLLLVMVTSIGGAVLRVSKQKAFHDDE